MTGALELHGALEADTLARTVWGEARGEGNAGMAAVAHVVINRQTISAQRGSMWWGDSIIQICQKPFQFSCWNKDDPNYSKALGVGSNDLVFVTAQRIARRVIYGISADTTNGATHYHVAGMTPYWVGKAKPVAIIGRQVFLPDYLISGGGANFADIHDRTVSRLTHFGAPFHDQLQLLPGPRQAGPDSTDRGSRAWWRLLRNAFP